MNETIRIDHAERSHQVSLALARDLGAVSVRLENAEIRERHYVRALRMADTFVTSVIEMLAGQNDLLDERASDVGREIKAALMLAPTTEKLNVVSG